MPTESIQFSCIAEVQVLSFQKDEQIGLSSEYIEELCGKGLQPGEENGGGGRVFPQELV